MAFVEKSVIFSDILRGISDYREVGQGLSVAMNLSVASFEGLVQRSDEDDEDLEALRMAALQTLGSNKPVTNDNFLQQRPLRFSGNGPGRGFRRGMPRTRPGRNQPVFQQHRLNSNLIAIVPMSNSPDDPAGRGVTEVVPKLELPQHRYCNASSTQEDKPDTPVVPSKFSRYDDSDSESSAEESEDDSEESDNASVTSGPENDPDVIVLAPDDEEDSLEKLMDELEQEMNKSDTNVPVNHCVKSAPKRKLSSDAPKNQKSVSTAKTSKVLPVASQSVSSVPVSNRHKETKAIVKDKNAHKDSRAVEKERSARKDSRVVEKDTAAHRDSKVIEKDRNVYKDSRVADKDRSAHKDNRMVEKDGNVKCSVVYQKSQRQMSPHTSKSLERQPSPRGVGVFERQISPKTGRYSEKETSPRSVRNLERRGSPRSSRNSEREVSPRMVRNSERQMSPRTLRNPERQVSPRTTRNLERQVSPRNVRNLDRRMSPRPVRNLERQASPRTVRNLERQSPPRSVRNLERQSSPRAVRNLERQGSPRSVRNLERQGSPRTVRNLERQSSPRAVRNLERQASPRTFRNLERRESPRAFNSSERRMSPRTVSNSERQMSPRPVASQRPISPRSPYSYAAPVLMSRRSRSPSPRNRYNYSPLRNRAPRSPKGRLSRTRSRSPVRPLRSPRRKYSRSPPSWDQSSNNVSRFSPQRYSPRPRRPLSPRQSPPPRLNRSSPRRSPERWWPSPRRSVSPHMRRSPLSPPKHPVSPRSRRISVSPRRPVSPLRRKLSPSPPRRNPSPPRRFSPPRRNPSPPRRRYSRSLSRSPDRFVARGRSPPGNRPLHHGSPVAPKRRMTRSPSPRRRLSRSPFSRGPPRHSPVGRKLSPWSPPKPSVNQRISPGVRRYSNSPGVKHRSLSPYGRQRRSRSPIRRPPVVRIPPRTQNSPSRDIRRPVQETRLVNNIRPKSRSPAHLHTDTKVRRSCSPRNSRSPVCRSRSPASSLSLSPSPERGMADSVRYKSPLRLHAAEFRNSPVPVHHASKEGSSNRQRNALSPVPEPVKKPIKSKSSKNREVRKEDVKTDMDKVSKEDQIVIGERIPVLESLLPKASADSSASTGNRCNSAVMEARRRKFEITGPVEPVGKKIRLKTTQPQEVQVPCKKMQAEQEEQAPQNQVTTAEEDDTDSLLLEMGEEFDLDESCLELENLWSSEESDSENEARFKSGARVQKTADVKMGVLPFTKLLGEAKSKNEKNKKSTTSRKSSSRDRVNEDVKIKKVISKMSEDRKPQTVDVQNVKKRGEKEQQQTDKEKKDALKSEISADSVGIPIPKVESKVECVGGEMNVETEEEVATRNREIDLRAELSRRRAERLTKAGSLHESLPARLVQSAFEGVVGKKGMKRIEREDKQSGKMADGRKEKSDVRRVLVLKRPTVPERRVASISVTIPKESKRERNRDSPPAKLPIRMRLGLPAAGEERLSSRRRNRKVKLKRNVMLDDKV